MVALQAPTARLARRANPTRPKRHQPEGSRISNPISGIEAIAFSITVSDLERSKRFYSEGLGFKIGAQQTVEIEAGSEDAKDMGLPGGAKLTNCFLSRPNMRIELIGYSEPKPFPGDAKPPNRTGLNMLHFAVQDVPTIIESLTALGGSLIQEWGGMRCALADPDGVRINCAAVPVEALRGIFAD